MTGVGRANGAGTVVNAFATGRGAAFGVGFRIVARVRPADRWEVRSGRRRLGASEARLAVEAAKAVQRRLHTSETLRIDVDSEIPPEKGLKSSSGVAVAIARAVLDHHGRRLSEAALLSAVADAGLRSGTSLTGAYDDAAACLLGGVVLTDNRRRRIIVRDRLPGTLVALVHVPTGRLATGSLRRRDFRHLADFVDGAWMLARMGYYRDAMLLNTLAYAPSLGHAPTFTLDALEQGAYAAGLSGKGPAEIALVHRDDLRRFGKLRRRAKVVPLVRGGR